jgi:SAM-dependent methyltransferase
MPAPVAARQPEGPGARWFARPLAQRLLHEEQRQAIPALTACYGQTGLYLRGAASAPSSLSGNMLQCVLSLHRAGAGFEGDLRCDDAELPLQRESIDLAYLLHAVEGSGDPARLLGEVERVLTPEGNLMLVMLNPYSLWRMRWVGSGLRPLGLGRCRALLRAAGFEVMRYRGLGPMLPWLSAQPWLALPNAGDRDPFAVWRAGYLIQARKRRRTMTPVRPRAGSVTLAPG